MSDQLITLLEYLPTILFIVILVYYFLRGMMRGFSKSLKLFITFLIAVGLAVAFYITISKMSYDTMLVTYGNTVLGWFGTSWDSLFKSLDSSFSGSYDTMTGYLEEYISSSDTFASYVSGSSVTTIAAIIYSLSCIVLNIVLFIFAIIVFFLAKFILYLVYLIFMKEKRRKKKIEKAYKDGKRDSGYHKHALAGGLVGLVRGLLVGIFIMGIFGTISYVVTDNESTDTTTTETDSTYAEMYEIINFYGTSGVVKILNSVSNSEGLPYYLIISKTLLETDYTYTNSDGEDVTVTLSLSDDLAPLSSSLCKTAYYFLLYGFDTNQASDTTYLTEFITSDTTIDGYTLEERISTVLDGVGLGSYFTSLLDSFATAYVNTLTDGVTDSDDSFSDLPLTTKILYHLFVGDNALSFSELLADGNIEVMFSTFCDVLNNMDTINSITGLYSSDESTDSSNISSETLAFGISGTLTDEEVDDGENVADLVKDDLSELSFYEDDSFDLVMTDVVKDVLGTYMTDFDFTSTTNEYIYDIDWSSSIDSVFGFLSDVVDTVVDNDIADTTALYDYYLTEMKDSSSDVYTMLDNALETSACCILLNTVGFSDFLETNINSSISNIISGLEITLPDVSYGSYTDSDGNYVEGQLKIILDTVGTSLADVYDIMVNPDTTSEDSDFYNLSDSDLQAAQISELIKILCDDDSDFRDLIDSTSTSYSILMHSVLSDVITGSSVTYSDLSMSFYLPSETEETITINSSTTKQVLSSTEFDSLFDFMYSISGDISDIMGGDIDYVSIIYDNSSYIKASQFVMANMSKFLYTYADTLNLVIPTDLDISDENIDTNITSWIEDDGEMTKMITAIVDNNDLLGNIVSGEDYNSYLVDIVLLEESNIEELANSEVINATLTSQISSLGSSDITIYIPYVAYSNDEQTTIKSSELIGMLSYIKALFDVTSDTTTIDFDSIDYSNVVSDDAIAALSDSSIMVATIANYFVNNMATLNSISSYLVIPDSLEENLNQENTTNIINDYEESPWKDELVNMLSNIDLLGISFSSDNNATIDLNKIFYLGDSNTTDTTRTNAEVLCDSEILQASITKTMQDQSQILVPDSCLNNDGYIEASDIAETFSSLKSLVDSDYYTDDGSDDYTARTSFNDIMSNIDLTVYAEDDSASEEENETKIESLISLIDPVIVNATLAQNIVDSISDSSSDTIYLPTELKFTSNDYSNLKSWLDPDDENEGETKLFLRAINELGLLSTVTSASNESIGQGITVDSFISSGIDFSVVTDSEAMWYTISHQIISTANLTVTSEVVTVNSNSEVYVYKTEISAFFDAISCLIPDDGTISEIKTDDLSASTIFANKTLLKSSSIIRNMVTQNIVSSTDLDIVLSIKADSDSVTNTYAGFYTVYDNSGSTGTISLSITSDEFNYFLTGIGTLSGDNVTTLSLSNYSLQDANFNSSVFESTIILQYFQSDLSSSTYNLDATPGSYIYWSNSLNSGSVNSKIESQLDDYISIETAKSIVPSST